VGPSAPEEAVGALQTDGVDGAGVGHERGGAHAVAEQRVAHDGEAPRRFGRLDAAVALIADAGLVGDLEDHPLRGDLAEQGLDGAPEAQDRSVASARIGGERAAELDVERVDDVATLGERAWQALRRGREARTIAAQHARHGAQRGLARLGRKRELAGEQLEEDRSEGEDVRLRGDARVAHLVLLGRRVAEARAGDRRGGLRADLGRLHEPEVGDLRELVALLVREQDVRGLEIAVHDAPLVHRVQRPRDLAHDAQAAIDRQARAALLLEHALQVGAVDQLDREERQRGLGGPLPMRCTPWS
jgi:hypothetical protein